MCSCRIIAGFGIDVEGAGSSANPYVISGEGGVGGSLQVNDTPTVDLSLTGGGTILDPAILTATATVSMSELTDVEDGVPGIGEAPIWNGAEFVYTVPGAAPPGTVATGCGLDGDGSGGNPLVIQARTGAQWTTDGFAGSPSSAGQPLYCAGPGEGAYGPPRHTSVRSDNSGVGPDRAAPAAPAFSAISGSASVTITNSTSRAMWYSFDGTARGLMTWDAGSPVADVYWSIVQDGGPEVTSRGPRIQSVGVNGLGWGFMIPAVPFTGTLAAGGTKTFLVGLKFQKISGADSILFSSIETRYNLMGWTI